MTGKVETFRPPGAQVFALAIFLSANGDDTLMRKLAAEIRQGATIEGQNVGSTAPHIAAHNSRGGLEQKSPTGGIRLGHVKCVVD